MFLWNILGGIVLTFLILLLASFACFHYKYLINKYKYLLIFFIFNCLMQTFSITMAISNIKNLWLLPIYTLGEYVIMHLYLHEGTNFKNTLQRKASMLLLFLMCMLILKDLLFISRINFNSITVGVKALVLVIWFIYIAIQEFKLVGSKQQNEKELNALSTLNFGFLFYFSVQFIVFFLSNFMLEQLSIAQNQFIWILNTFLSIIFYAILFIGIWKLISVRKQSRG